MKPPIFYKNEANSNNNSENNNNKNNNNNRAKHSPMDSSSRGKAWISLQGIPQYETTLPEDSQLMFNDINQQLLLPMTSNKRGKGKRPSGTLHLQSRSLDGIGTCWSASLEHRRRSESFLAAHSTLPLQAKPEPQNDFVPVVCQFLTFSRSLGWARSFSLFWRDSIFWAQVDPFVVEPHPEHFQSAEEFLDFF